MIVKALWTYPQIEHKILWSGQHYSEGLSSLFFKSLSLPKPDLIMDIGSESQGKVLIQHENIKHMADAIESVTPDIVMVYGDCNTTWLGAEAAYFMNIPVAHIEAGCRCGDERMLEEKNRILTDRISKYLFCPTPHCVDNLKKEGMEGEYVGDLMLDPFLYSQSIIDKVDMSKYPLYDVLLTLHRAESSSLEQIIAILGDLGDKKVFWPVHPRNQKFVDRLDKQGYSNVTFSQPIDYFELLAILRKVTEVWTDSGGVTREAYFSGKPVKVLRKLYEWSELADNPSPNPCGDGRAAQKILKILTNGISR